MGLEDFVVTKVDFKHNTITLNLPRPERDLPDDSYRVRLKYGSTAGLPDCDIGQPLPTPVVGRVLKTRASQWADEMNKVLPDWDFDLNGEVVRAADGSQLPNPLVALPTFLKTLRSINVYFIHGDLNLENIIVDLGARDVQLIDFAEARWDHVLHDFMRLETEVVTKLIPPALAEAGLPSEIMGAFYAHLHQATFQSPPLGSVQSPHPKLDRAFLILSLIRQTGREQRALFIPNGYEEYYQCLVLYLLGALKFRSLDHVGTAPRPKQAAFWGAAALTALLSNQEAGWEKLAKLGVPDSELTRARSLGRTTESALTSRRDHLHPDAMEPAGTGGISVGDVYGHSIAIGDGAQVTIAQGGENDRVVRLFEAIYQRINIRSEDPNVRGKTLIGIVKVIEYEVARGGAADPHKVERWLKDLNDVAPDVAQATIECLRQPNAGVPPRIRLIAARAGDESDNPVLPAPD